MQDQDTQANLQIIVQNALEQIKQCSNQQELDKLKANLVGKNSQLVAIQTNIRNLSLEEKTLVGKELNHAKIQIFDSIEFKKNQFDNEFLQKKLNKNAINATLPIPDNFMGNLHFINHTQRRIEDIFVHLGYDIVYGPEIESDDYCFSALNIPDNHPARNMQDTFYINKKTVLRTHTSPVQIRSIEKYGVPIAIACPGKVYRSDSDLTHTPMFHQIEGLVIDKNITMSHLKSTLKKFLQLFFENDSIKTRMRPSYFPFTEPSAEVDMSCIFCQQKGCSVCKSTGWIEILGSGMVHPKVLENLNIDTKVYTGFAFGVGLERMCFLYYQIDDIRRFFDNDLDFLKQINI